MQGSARKDVVFGAAGVYPVTVPGPKWKSWLNASPARPGDVIVIYATGLGPVNIPVPTGEATPDSPLAHTLERPNVNYSTSPFGLSERAEFSGLSPRFVGLYQVNVPIPETAATNRRTPITIGFNDGTRSNTVHIAVER